MLSANAGFQPGDEAMYDRTLRVRVVRTLPGGSDTIVRIGADSTVVKTEALSRFEA